MILALYSKIPSDLLLSPYVFKSEKLHKLRRFLKGSGIQDNYTIICYYEISSILSILIKATSKESIWSTLNISPEKFKEKENSYFNYIANK